MRKSSLWFWYLSLSFLLTIMLVLHAAAQRERSFGALRLKAEMVRAFQLTDLCLFTEARYTRHPSQADLNTPFQDHPLSLEHFPSGSLMPPKNGRSEFHASVD